MNGTTAETDTLGQARWQDFAARSDNGGLAARRHLDLRRLLADDGDLVVLAALLMLTLAFGRSFTRIGIGGTLFISEVLLVATIGLALVRHGLPQAWRRVRSRIPLPLLGLYWIVGVIATLRGLEAFGLSMVIEDIGLFEYSVLLPLVALVVADRRRFEMLGGALLIGSAVAIALFLATSIGLRAAGDGPLIFLVGSASGMYISFFVIWIAARAINGVAVSRWELSLAGLGLLLMWVTDQRSVWLAMLLAAIALVASAPRGRRPLAAAGVVSAVVATGALYLALASAFPIPAADGSSTPGPQPQPIEEARGLSGSTSEEGANVRWRLAYWGELTERTVTDASTAAIGAGFGKPAAFTWQGRKYDFRDGDPAAQMDVGGPHNSFVAIMYRMGVPALLAVLALLAIGFRRMAPLLREGRLANSHRVEVVTILCALLSTSAIAAFNEALKGPFLGMFFWVVLALMLVYPVIAQERYESTGARGTGSS